MFGRELQWGSYIDNSSSATSNKKVCKRKLWTHNETCKSTELYVHVNNRSHVSAYFDTICDCIYCMTVEVIMLTEMYNAISV